MPRSMMNAGVVDQEVQRFAAISAISAIVSLQSSPTGHHKSRSPQRRNPLERVAPTALPTLVAGARTWHVVSVVQQLFSRLSHRLSSHLSSGARCRQAVSRYTHTHTTAAPRNVARSPPPRCLAASVFVSSATAGNLYNTTTTNTVHTYNCR